MSKVLEHTTIIQSPRSLKSAGTNEKVTYKSPLRYPDGKQKAIEQIFEVFPRRNLFPNGILEYREPLVGGGSIFSMQNQLILQIGIG